MDTLVVLTLTYATLSASFRGIISVLDRKLFGHKKTSIALTNLVNNLLAFLLCTLLALFFTDTDHLLAQALQWKIMVFALLLQGGALAFSWAFRHMRVHHVIIASKSADLLIPFALLLATQSWETENSLFSFATFVACLPILYHHRRSGHLHWPATSLIALILTLQGGLSPFLVQQDGASLAGWISYTTGLIFWRLIWMTLFSLPKLRLLHGDQAKADPLWHPSALGLTTLRSILTIGAQVFLVLSVGIGIKALAWPILNATGLISVVISSWLLKEKPGRVEILALLAIFALSLLRAL